MVSSPNQGGVIAVASILIATSAIAVALRFRSRQVKRARILADDYLSIVAWLLQIGLAVILIVGAANGSLGTHTLQNPVTHKVIVTWHEIDVSKLAGISQLILIINLGVLKATVVLLYRRIFASKVFRQVSLGVLVLIVCWTIAFAFATIFECGSDWGLLWQSLATFKMDCGKYSHIQLAHAITDIITDFIVLSMPIPVIWSLHMTTSRKLQLIVIFLLGLTATAAGLARLVIVAEDLYETTTGSRDVRGVETNAMVWSYVEVGVGVFAACLPTFKPLLSMRTPESIVNSVRSAISLPSIRSKGSQGSGSRTANNGTGASMTRDPEGHDLTLINKSVDSITPVPGSRHGESASIHRDGHNGGIMLQNDVSVREERLKDAGQAV